MALRGGLGAGGGAGTGASAPARVRPELAVLATVWYNAFWLKLALCAVCILVYCLMYRAELLRCWQLGLSILRGLFARGKK